jgi:hypothetical protein
MIALAFVCGTTFAADPPLKTIPPGSVSKVAGLDGSKETSTLDPFGSRIRVYLESVPGDTDLYKLVPYLDGHALKGTYPLHVSSTNDGKGKLLEYQLPDKQTAKAEWRPILRRPSADGERLVDVSIGPDEGRQWPPADYRKPPRLTVQLFASWWWLLLIAIGIVGIALCVFAVKSNVLRDGTPRPADKSKRPPYSLAKTQAAFWFFLVFATFGFIWFMTGDYNGVMTNTALALIGIGSGTTLGAAMIEVARSDEWRKDREKLEQDLAAEKTKLAAAPSDPDIQERIASLEQRIRPASRSLLMDLVTDVNGITLHRFQMIVWTLALAAVFVIAVYDKLAMPDFDATLLALLGISSGVYLGFKIPEKQT